MTARSRHTENSAFVKDEAPTSCGIITKGQRWGARRDRRRGGTGRGGEGGGLKKASLVGASSAPRRLYRGDERGKAGDKGGGQETRGSERSDETKEEGRPMLGDKSRLTSRERGL